MSTIGKNVYAGCDGTSFSTAICTGLASLLLEKNNDKIRVKQYLEEIEYTKEIDFIKAIEGFNNE